jgi:hypothetical protein
MAKAFGGRLAACDMNLLPNMISFRFHRHLYYHLSYYQLLFVLLMMNGSYPENSFHGKSVGMASHLLLINPTKNSIASTSRGPGRLNIWLPSTTAILVPLLMYVVTQQGVPAALFLSTILLSSRSVVSMSRPQGATITTSASKSMNFWSSIANL